MSTAPYSSDMQQEFRRGRIPTQILFLAALVFFTLQLLSGTQSGFAIMVFLFIVFFGMAFNALEGFASVNGIAISAMALKTIFFSQILKLCLWQPADLYLDSPVPTLRIFAVGMFTVAVVAMFIQRMKFERTTLFRPEMDPDRLDKIALISLVLGSIGSVVYFSVGLNTSIGRLAWGATSYLAYAESLAVIAAVSAQIIRTGKRHSLSKIAVFSILTQLAMGLFATSKTRMFEPFVAYALTCVCFGFLPKSRHFVGGALAVFLAVSVFAPLANAMRSVVIMGTLFDNSSYVFDFLKSNASSVESLSRFYGELESDDRSALDELSYYGKWSGLAERFSLIGDADRLVNTTLKKGPMGYGFFFRNLNILPNSITGNTTFNSLNYLGKWTGMVDDEDDVTQVSYTIFADAFCIDEWSGVVLLSGFCFLVFFGFTKWLFPQVSSNVWAIWMVMMVQNPIAESSPEWLLFHVFRTVPFCAVLCLFLRWATEPPRMRSALTGAKLKRSSLWL